MAPPSPSGPPRRGSPPGQGGLQILARAPVGDVSAIMQLKFQQSFEFFVVPQIQFFARVLDISAACRDWYAQCQNRSCRPWLIAQVTVLGLVVATTGAWVRNSLVRQWIFILRQFKEGFMDEFPYFLREGGTLDPQVDSCFFPANMAEEEVAAFVVYMAVACILLVCW